MADATGVRQYAGAAAQSALVAGVTSGTTSFSITISTNWPDGSIGNFVVTADPGTSLEEKMLCSALAGGVLTIVTRGYDGTTAVAHAANSTVYPTLSAIDIAEANWIANFHARTSKATPVDADEIPLADSAATFGLKKLTFTNLKAAVFTAIGALTGKTTPVGADTFAISDSAASGVGKSVTWTNILATIQALTDTLYAKFKGPTVNTQTASYVLVASDVGKRVVMNAAGATTITVNTSLFGAGDTLEILNIGAGVCTITAGTATVSTAGTLALVQNAGGKLYFTSAGVSTFIPSGVATSSGAVKLFETTLVGAAGTISVPSINQTYSHLRIVWETVVAAGAGNLLLKMNADSGANYDSQFQLGYGTTANVGEQFASTAGMKIGQVDSVVAGGEIIIPNYSGSTIGKMAVGKFSKSGGTSTGLLEVGNFGGRWRSTAAITQLDFTNDAGNFAIGTKLTVYGE